MFEKIEGNTYHYETSDDFIDFELCVPEFGDVQLNLNNDISEDNVLLIPQVYPTLDGEDPIIADAYLFNGKKCIRKGMVTAKILDTSFEFADAKRILEVISF